MQIIVRTAALAAAIALAPSIGAAQQGWFTKGLESPQPTDQNPYMGQWGLHQMLETHEQAMVRPETSGGDLACHGKHDARMGCAPETGFTAAPAAESFRGCDAQANIEAVCPRQ